MGKLAVKQLESLTPQDVGRKLFDGDGLYGRVRLQKTGIVVSFEYRFKLQSKTRTISCGKWPNSSLRDIREIRSTKQILVRQGIDPVEQNKAEKLKKKMEIDQAIAEKQIRLAELASRRTLSNAIYEWQTLELVQRKDRGKEIIRAIEKDIIPTLGDTALIDITRAMLMDALYRVVKRDARVMANRLFAGLRQFYNFAVTREWVDTSPLTGISQDKIGGRQKERERYLSEIEITELSHCLPKSGLRFTTQIAIWIMLSTCCRVGEISKARWDDVDFSENKWIIPAENTKNAKDHVIFLSSFSKQQFQKLKSLTNSSNWCLPARNSQHHIHLQSIAKQVKDRIRDKPLVNRAKATNILLLSSGTWTPHDLRRTGATMMGELGILGDIIERCLNHVEQNKLKRIYQRHELKEEQRHAWETLGNKLETLVKN